MERFGFTASDITDITQAQALGKHSCYRHLHNVRPGINTIKFAAVTHDGIRYMHYILLQIEPNMLAHLNYFRLFLCTPTDNDLLTLKFRQFMTGYTDTSEITKIENWKLHRIDFTHDIQETTNHELLLRLMKKADRKLLKRKGTGKYNNLEKKRNNSKFIIYDKERHISEKCAEGKAGIYDSMFFFADRIRIELQCGSSKISKLREAYGITDKSVLPFLTEDIAERLLRREYMTTIGSGDFYTLYWATKRIMDSDYSGYIKSKLVQFVQCIAQKRHVLDARAAFSKGIRLKRTNTVVKGSDATFLVRLHQLDALGINPILIPKDWHKQYPELNDRSCIRNPIPAEWKN